MNFLRKLLIFKKANRNLLKRSADHSCKSASCADPTFDILRHSVCMLCSLSKRRSRSFLGQPFLLCLLEGKGGKEENDYNIS